MNMNRARIKSIVVLNLCVYKCQAGDLPAQQILSTSRRPILKSLESCLIMDISFSPRFFRRFYDRAIEKLRALREIDLFLGFVAYREIVPKAPRGWVLVRLICMKIVTKILTTLSFPTDLNRRVSLGVSRIERNREHSTDFQGTRLRRIPRGIRSVSLFVCAASFCSPTSGTITTLVHRWVGSWHHKGAVKSRETKLIDLGMEETNAWNSKWLWLYDRFIDDGFGDLNIARSTGSSQ